MSTEAGASSEAETSSELIQPPALPQAGAAQPINTSGSGQGEESETKATDTTITPGESSGAAPLRSLGYAFKPATRSDDGDSESGYERLVDLNTGRGFEWKGQRQYDTLSDAVLEYVEGLLVDGEGLRALQCPTPADAERVGYHGRGSTVFASDDLFTNTNNYQIGRNSSRCICCL